MTVRIPQPRGGTPTTRTRSRGFGRGEPAGFVVLALLLAAFPLLASESVVNVGVYALIYGLAAIGLTLLMGLAGQVSLGQAAFFAISAYGQAVLVTRYQVPMVVAAIIAVGLAMLAALLVGLPLLRLRGHYLALATLGLGIIVTVAATESEFLGATSGIYGVYKPTFGGRRYDSPAEYFWLLAPVVFLALLLARNIVAGRIGRALGAVNDSEVAAECLGVDTFRLRLQVFVLSAGFAGLAGVAYVHWIGVVNPNAANFPLSVEFLLMSVLGGLGSVWGAIIGAFAVELLDEGLRSLIPTLVPGAEGEVQLVGFGVVLTAVILFVPGGIHEVWRRLLARLQRPAPASDEPAAVGTDVEVDAAPLLAREGRPAAGAPLLQVRDLTRRFGGVTAVNAVSFDVRAGEIFALIGPNGAGKTTCFNMISGVLTPSAGSVRLGDTRIDGRKPHVFARARATRTFQNLQIFRSTTVRGNVSVGRHLRSGAGMLRGALSLPARAEERQIQRSVDELLALTGLAADADRPAADLPFGRQRQLEIARALALEPDLLLLDEPMAGLSGAERHDLVRLLRRLRAGGMAIVLVEHDVEAVLALADRVAVLDDGHLIALGTPDEVRQDPAVLAAYLGVGDDQEEVVASAPGADGEPARKDGA
ncbi:branched-chain amino acid transport system permease protein [Micromonospora rhizosphaerae]|uniref:Branched-chain amino acid transport system permease protein n=1 Tax=Micromonospora rhizosphaerae TaxID=568872 RepID=A0A1C6SW86_9ACTN|nr:ATP-binding cassette domain-containing protein [Micromonospora rhizosphaerae]SCL33582.1 branched-chain amino acid transport system permease protein [Micromonospora rhizosphaerae]